MRNGPFIVKSKYLGACLQTIYFLLFELGFYYFLLKGLVLLKSVEEIIPEVNIDEK